LRPSSSERLRPGENGDVLEHGLAAVAEAGGLDGADVQGAAQVVDDEGGQGFAFDILGDDEKRLAGLGDLLKQGKKILHVGDLLVVDEDEGFSKTVVMESRLVTK